MIPRLKAGIFVRALIRRAEVAGAQAYVVKKGSEEAGAVFLKVSRLDGTCIILNQVRPGDGKLAWARPLGGLCRGARLAYFEKQDQIRP